MEEVITAIKNASPHKSPDPNGFDGVFFRICWPIVGSDVFEAISNFFKIGTLVKQVKNNFTTPISKNEAPSKVADY